MIFLRIAASFCLIAVCLGYNYDYDADSDDVDDKLYETQITASACMKTGVREEINLQFGFLDPHTKELIYTLKNVTVRDYFYNKFDKTFTFAQSSGDVQRKCEARYGRERRAEHGDCVLKPNVVFINKATTMPWKPETITINHVLKGAFFYNIFYFPQSCRAGWLKDVGVYVYSTMDRNRVRYIGRNANAIQIGEFY